MLICTRSNPTVSSTKDTQKRQISLGQFGVPLTTLSGTLPGPLVESLYEYLGLRLDRLITGRTLLGIFPKGFRIETVQSSQLVHDTVICTKGKVTKESSTCVHVIVATKQQCTDIAQCLKQSTNLSVEALSSDEPSSRQEAVAQQWRSGDIRILVSTTCALCGNENHNCRHVIVCGMIYSLMNIVQAVGRLRPSQRKPDGSVTLLYSTGHTARDLQEDQTLRLLEDKGLLTGSESRAHLESVFGSSSIAKWLAERTCRVQGLSRRFGLEVDCCGVCDWCVEQSSQSGHSRVRERVRNEDIDAEKAESYLARLTRECIVCKEAGCNGESCLPYGACFHCGQSGHQRGQCQVNFRTVLSNKACFYCFDVFSRRGYKQHHPSACPLQRRLKRLMIDVYESRKTNGQSRAMTDFMSEVTCDSHSFHAFLCQSVEQRMGMTVTQTPHATTAARPSVARPALPRNPYAKKAFK